MSSRFAFHVESQDNRRRELPERVFIGRKETETTKHVLLKFLGFVLFHRERLQIEAQLHDDNIPFTPDLVQLDYTMRPALWVECGEVSVAKLEKLAVKVPEAEIWIVKRSPGEAETLLRDMARHDLRRNRYRVVVFDPEMFDEALASLGLRNDVFWARGDFDPPQLQFDFNGLWFDCEFQVLKF
jgi:uncharacterized protein YaeQ